MKEFSESDLVTYLNDRMEPADVHELEEALRRDPLLRKALLVLANFEAELPVALKHEAIGNCDSKKPSARPVMRWVMRTMLPLAAAAGLVLALRLILPPTKPDVHGPLAVAPVIELPVVGHLVELNGNVRICEGNSENPILVVSSGTVVHAGATIALATNASACFAFLDGSELRLYQGTVLVLKQTSTGSSVELQRGAVDASIRPQPANHMLVMHTSFLHAEIVGTEFRLMADSKSAWLGVRKGEVRVTREADGKKVNLADGNYAAVAPNWPFMRMNARVCPLWKSVCHQAAGTPYP
jgi:ferric-dicitrate binding protein FerR (iron transport regulator)